MTDLPPDPMPVAPKRPRTFSEKQPAKHRNNPPLAPLVPDTPRSHEARTVETRDRGFGGQLTPEHWEIAVQPESGIRPGLDLELGDAAQAARMVRDAIRAGKLRLVDIPESFTELAKQALRMAKAAADEGKTSVFAQMAKLALDIQKENREVLKLVDNVERLDAGLPTGITGAPTASPEAMKRIESIVATQKAAPAPELPAGSVASDELAPDSPMADILGRIEREESAALEAKEEDSGPCDDSTT